MSRELLKIIAMVTMVFDHSALVGLAGGNWMAFNAIGRLAFPIFAYQVATGFYRTSNRKKYLRNMGIFALVSEIPFNLIHGSVVDPFSQNVMITFFLALLALSIMDKFAPFPWTKPLQVLKNMVICFVTVCVFYLLGFITFVDYFGMGILLVILIYFILSLPQTSWMKYIQVVLIGGAIVYMSDSLGGMYVDWHGMEITIQMLATFAIIPIGLYILTGEKKQLSGKTDTAFKYFCYAFYPLHLTILYLIASSTL